MNRREQNAALQAWNSLKADIDQLDKTITAVLARGTYDSGERRLPKTPGDREEKSPAPAYNDETGELAIRFAVDDPIHKDIVAMVRNLHLAASNAKKVLAVTPENVAERARRTVPDCLACHRPVEGRVLSGYDRSCYEKWTRAGRPDRAKFERDRLADMGETGLPL